MLEKSLNKTIQQDLFSIKKTRDDWKDTAMFFRIFALCFPLLVIISATLIQIFPSVSDKINITTIVFSILYPTVVFIDTKIWERYIIPNGIEMELYKLRDDIWMECVELKVSKSKSREVELKKLSDDVKKQTLTIMRKWKGGSNRTGVMENDKMKHYKQSKLWHKILFCLSLLLFVRKKIYEQTLIFFFFLRSILFALGFLYSQFPFKD